MKNLLPDLKRLLLHPKTYLASLGVTAALFFSVQDTFARLDAHNAAAQYLAALDLSGFLIAYIFCALPFATVFCEDIQDRYIRQTVIRSGIRSYVLSKMLVIYVSALLSMVLGSVLFYAIESVGVQEPFYNVDAFEAGYYGGLLAAGHYFLYCLATAVQMGMLAGTLAVTAAFVSLYISSRVATLAMPVLFHQVLLEFSGKGISVMIFKPSSGRVFEADGKNTVAVICMSLIPVAILSCGAIRKIRKVL